MKMKKLPSSRIAPGHCVIVNQFDRPCAKLVAVVLADGKCCYLNQAINFRKMDASNATPVSDFGIAVMARGDSYSCVVVGDSVAKYPDGSPRLWQDSQQVQHKRRRRKQRQ